MGYESMKRSEVRALHQAMSGNMRLLQHLSGKHDLQSGVYEIFRRHIECAVSVIDLQNKALERLVREAPFDEVTVVKDLVLSTETDYYDDSGRVVIRLVNEIPKVGQELYGAKENYYVLVDDPSIQGPPKHPIGVELDPYLEHIEFFVKYLLTKQIDSFRFHTTSEGSTRVWDMFRMLREFSEQSEEYTLNDKYNRDERDGTRINIDMESRYSLRKGDKEALVLQINTSLLEDEFGVAVPGGLPCVYIELLDPNLRSLYDRLTSFANEISYMPQKK